MDDFLLRIEVELLSSPLGYTAQIKEFVETTITIEKETTGLGLGVVGGSDTYLVWELLEEVHDYYSFSF